MFIVPSTCGNIIPVNVDIPVAIGTGLLVPKPEGVPCWKYQVIDYIKWKHAVTVRVKFQTATSDVTGTSVMTVPVMWLRDRYYDCVHYIFHWSFESKVCTQWLTLQIIVFSPPPTPIANMIFWKESEGTMESSTIFWLLNWSRQKQKYLDRNDSYWAARFC